MNEAMYQKVLSLYNNTASEEAKKFARTTAAAIGRYVGLDVDEKKIDIDDTMAANIISAFIDKTPDQILMALSGMTLADALVNAGLLSEEDAATYDPDDFIHVFTVTKAHVVGDIDTDDELGIEDKEPHVTATIEEAIHLAVTLAKSNNDNVVVISLNTPIPGVSQELATIVTSEDFNVCDCQDPYIQGALAYALEGYIVGDFTDDSDNDSDDDNADEDGFESVTAPFVVQVCRDISDDEDEDPDYDVLFEASYDDPDEATEAAADLAAVLPADAKLSIVIYGTTSFEGEDALMETAFIDLDPEAKVFHADDEEDIAILEEKLAPLGFSQAFGEDD